MRDWTTVEGEAALGEGQLLPVDLDGVGVLLVRHHGCIYALENRCTHDGTELTGGTVEDDAVVCPHHGARFSLADGAALCAPAYEALTTFPVRVEDGCIQVRDDRW